MPPLSPLQPISGEEAVQVTAGPLPPSSVTLRDYVDFLIRDSEEVSASRSGFIQDRKTSRCSQPPATGF